MTDVAEIDQKEHHRLGTMGKWDPPEADWAAEYDWTRYRGPKPWPVPAGWVFGDPEGGGWWTYFGDAGVGHHKKNGILDELKADDSVEDPYDAWDELCREYGQHASLTAETANPDEVSMRNPGNEQLEWTLEVDGTQVFRRVEPDRPDLMAAVAEALDAYHEGELEERCEEIVPTSGRKPADVREQEEQERREEENESLDEFATDGGIKRSRSRDHGHVRRGYAVEFNLDGVCSCRTLTVETQLEAEQFARMLEDREDTSSVQVVLDD